MCKPIDSKKLVKSNITMITDLHLETVKGHHICIYYRKCMTKLYNTIFSGQIIGLTDESDFVPRELWKHCTSLHSFSRVSQDLECSTGNTIFNFIAR